MSLPILKSSLTNPDGSPSPLLLNKERGKRALAKAKARKHLLDFTQYTSPDYNTNWHHKIICDYLERWAFGDLKRLMIFMPPGSGKALEVHTPIPTPTGWTEIQNLVVGDRVFDEQGRICNVIAKSPIWKDRICYPVLTDNEIIIADADHEWIAQLWTDQNFRSYTTEELAKRSSPKTPKIFHQESLQLPEVDLPIDPYVLGAWLGDGDNANATMTQGSTDIEFLRNEFNRAGYVTTDRKTENTFGILDFKRLLIENNLLHNKHIPIIYLRSSNKQRLSLLQGLIDTDGYVSEDGHIEFSNINKNIAYGVYELVHSLGYKVSIIKKNAKLYGRITSECYSVYFFMKDAARMPRKRDKCRDAIKYRDRYVKFENSPLISDTVCIQVDSPSGMFLCGKSMLPTHNSELVSRRLPAWIFGKNPNVGIMATSYAASLVEDMNIDVQRIMDSEAYKEVFPEVSLSSRNSRNSLVGSTASRNRGNFEIVGHKGYYKCAGVGGSITGKRFFYGIIDDPLRGRQDAESVTIRNTTYNWYVNDFYTRRLNQDARILITLTRWHADDLAGRLLSLAASNPKAEQWTVLKFPMVAEDPLEPGDPRQIGECLWPWRYGSLEDIEATKISAGTYTWSSLYQQRPSPPGGTIFNRGWWGDPIAVPPNRNQFYPAEPLSLQNHMDIVVLSADCTFKETDGTDYVVIQVWARKGSDFYLLDQKRDRMDIITTMQNIRTLSAKWPRVTAKLIEDKANGPAVITMLKRELPGLIPIEPQGGKVVRAQAITPYIESGNVWLPQPKNAPWLHDLLEELAAFPTARHDDQVDALTQAIFYLNNRSNFVLPK